MGINLIYMRSLFSKEIDLLKCSVQNTFLQHVFHVVKGCVSRLVGQICEEICG